MCIYIYIAIYKVIYLFIIEWYIHIYIYILYYIYKIYIYIRCVNVVITNFQVWLLDDHSRQLILDPPKVDIILGIWMVDAVVGDIAIFEFMNADSGNIKYIYINIYHNIPYHIIYHISYIIYHISYIIYHIISWLVASTPLKKNISQLGLLWPIYGKIETSKPPTSYTHISFRYPNNIQQDGTVFPG